MTPKITYADLSEGRNVTAQPSLVQWNRGNFLNVSGVDLPASYKVEFSNKGDNTTSPATVYSDSIEIPNALLETGRPIIAYVVMIWEDGRSTEYWITINVKPRPEPSDEEPDPGQQSEVEQLIAALNHGVETAEGYAQAAGEQAEAAAGSAEDAADAATLAESWAVGGTGTREDEDNDNAKHYAELAAQGAEESGYAWFDVHDDDGHMYIYISDNLSEDVSFAVEEATGRLAITYN